MARKNKEMIMANENPQADLSARPLPFLLVWGIPLAILLSVNLLAQYVPAAALLAIMAGAYLWMGIGCSVNGRRCGRLHCRLAGPVLIAGALGVLIVGFQVIDTGAIYTSHVSYATLLLVALTFVPEFIWGKYGERRNSG